MSMLKVGDVCIWQNQVGREAFLNGTECTIIGALEARHVFNMCGDQQTLSLCYEVDTKIPGYVAIFAEPKELRLKNPPTSPEAEREYNSLIERLTDRVPA